MVRTDSRSGFRSWAHPATTAASSRRPRGSKRASGPRSREAVGSGSQLVLHEIRAVVAAWPDERHPAFLHHATRGMVLGRADGDDPFEPFLAEAVGQRR